MCGRLFLTYFVYMRGACVVGCFLTNSSVHVEHVQNLFAVVQSRMHVVRVCCLVHGGVIYFLLVSDASIAALVLCGDE
jgi:hypothetical protein